MSVVLAAVTPIAVRIAALDVATLGRTAGPPLRGLDRREHRRDVRDGVRAHPRVRHEPAARARRRRAPRGHRARRGRALAADRRRRRARRGRGRRSALVVARAGAGRHAHRCRRARTTRRSTAPARRASAAAARLRGRGLPRFATARTARYHSIAVVEDDVDRYLRFDSSFQSAMDLDDPFVTPFDYVRLSLARVRVPPGGGERALRRARRRLGAEARLARLPRRAAAGGRARPRGRRRRAEVVRAAAGPAARRRGRRRPSLPPAERPSAGT